MTNIKLNYTDDNIEVTSPYNGDFVGRVKKIGGKWNANAKVWAVPVENEELLKGHLTDVYGYVDAEEETIKVTLRAKDFKYNNDIRIGSWVLATRRGRDYDVRLADGVYLVDGDFDKSGGSKNHPSVDPNGSEILEINLPVGIYDKLTEDEKALLTKVEDKKVSVLEALEARKAKLLAELEEIEKAIEANK